MSNDLPKKGVKRSPSPERNTSFVQNVTAQISGIFSNNFKKWFRSPTTSSGNGNVNAVDISGDSSSDDEAIDSQRPSKRARFTSPQKYHHPFSYENQKIAPESNHSVDQSASFFGMPSTPGPSSFRAANFASTPIDATVEKTIKRHDREESVSTPNLNLTKNSLVLKKKSKPLFCTEQLEKSACTSNTSVITENYTRPPYFRASLLASPFYNGQTTYAGASASNYVNQPNVKKTSAVVNENSNSNDTVSNAVRHVMDLLESYSSPIKEAKRIPQYKRNETSSDTSIKSSSISTRINDYTVQKRQEPYVPSVASFLNIKRRSRLMDSTNEARRIMASQSSTMDISSYPYMNQLSNQEPNRRVGKMKTSLTRPKRGESSKADEEISAPFYLPKVVLNIEADKIPKFTLGSIENVHKANSETNKIAPSPKKKPIEAKTNMVQTKSNMSESIFKFAKPIYVSQDSHDFERTQYAFGSPNRNLDNKAEINCVPSAKSNSSAPLEKWQCSECWVQNEAKNTKCVCCGSKKQDKSTNSNKCSLCKTLDRQTNSDKCINCEKVKSVIDKPSVKLNNVSNKWNETSTPESTSTPIKAALSKIDAKISSNWTCKDCWVTNKADIEKCVACGGAKPGHSTTVLDSKTTASIPLAKESVLSTIAKSQNEKWECPSCLVRNDNDKLKCACCLADKPGSAASSEEKTSFQFGIPKTTFKFGIVPAQTTQKEEEKCDDKKETSSIKDDQPEKNNNNLSVTPKFSFGNLEKSSETTTTETKLPAQSNFTFGLPKSSAPDTTSNTKITFSATSQLENKPVPEINKKSETEQEVPNDPVSTPVVSQTPTTFEYFNPSGAKQDSGTGFSLVASPASQKPATMVPPTIPTLNSQVVPAVTSESTTKNMFLFTSTPDTKSSSNVIAPPAKTATTWTQESTKAPTPSLNPSEATPFMSTIKPITLNFNTTSSTPAASLTAPATTTATSTTAAPWFGFGSSTNTQPEQKPMFNFTFNKSDSIAAFKQPPPFAAKDDTSANKFNVLLNNSGSKPKENILSVPNVLSLPNSTSTSITSPPPSIFGANLQKENVWPTNNNAATNLFESTTATTASTPFTFGSTPLSSQNTPFGVTQTNESTPKFTFGASNLASNASPAFGNTQNVQQVTPFGNPVSPSNNSVPLFGAVQTTPKSTVMQGSTFGMPSTNMFGNPTQSATSQPTSLFGNSVQQNSIFGNPQPTQNANQTMHNIFGGSTPAASSQPFSQTFSAQPISGISAFGTPNNTTPAAATPTPAFNFSAQSPGTFGFGQKSTQSPGVYSFGATSGGPPQVQFNMGSASTSNQSPSGRRLLKAVRRSTQR